MDRDVGCVPVSFLAAGLLLAALTASPAEAQDDFRRGDANADGVVDVSDASFINRFVFLADVSPTCMEAADTGDEGSVDLTDEVRILNFFFLGLGNIPAPGPVIPGLDPTPGLGCISYDPAAPPRHADLDLALECLGPDPSGEPGRHLVAITLTTRNNTAGEGAEAWSLSLGAEGYRVLDVTHAGTAAALTDDIPPGYRDSLASFSWREVIDPDRIVGGSPQGPGAVAAVQLTTVGSAQIPAEGTVRLLILTVEKTGTGPRGIFFEDGKQGSGQPVRNVITIHGASQAPSLGTFGGCVDDCNSNGTADETDIGAGTSKDCDANSIPDECDISAGTSRDCNANGIPDSCDIGSALSTDCDQNSVPDECEPDCNANGITDACDIARGTSRDCNSNGIPDACDGSEDPNDCNANGEPDRCDIRSGTSQDCDANGIPDSCDIAAGRSSDCDGNGVPDDCEPDCNSNDRADACDIATGESPDVDDDGIPDECDCNCACPSTPITCPGGEPVFRLGLRGDCEIGGDPQGLRVKAFATLEQFCSPPIGGGAQGWSFGIEILDGTPVSATTTATAAAPTTEGGFRNPTGSFEKTQVIDPSKNLGRKGVVSAVALSTEGPGTFELPPVGSPYDILRLEVELSLSATCPRTTLRYVDGLAGTGKPLAITVTFDGGSHHPITDAATWYRCSGGGFQFPGDGNQDGATNIADAIWLLGHLFLGTFPVLPCDGGNAAGPGPGALALLDLSGDGAIDVTDPINLLNFLFAGGPPPPLGIGCVGIEGCLDACAP